MNHAERIEHYIPLVPPELKRVLDAMLAAGNELNDVELGRGDKSGRVAIILNHPFKAKPALGATGVAYREFLDRDPMIFEYHTANEMWSLVTGKFKPMKFQKIEGPPDPMPAHLERMRKIEERDRAAAKKRAQEIRNPSLPPPPPPNPKVGTAGNRFLSSMIMTFDMWHDGLGYDLEALAEVTSPAERESIESILINHSPRDWRDIEALAQFDTLKAKAEVEKALKSSNIQVRQEAMRHAPEEKVDPADREKRLIVALETTGLYGGLSQAIDEAEDFHPPAVVETLIKGALNGSAEAAVHFAALLFFLHGKSKEAFDWSHRPFFLRFGEPDRKERIAAFRELCEKIGVDVKKYLRD